MSELKARTDRSIADAELGADCPIEQAQVYLKSEADKVIAEKDKEIADLQKQVHDYAQGLYVIQAKAEKEARHDKYKRCLAMAAYCNAKIEEYQANYDADEGFGDEWLYWIKFMRKWMRRWLEFADKLKECF